MFERREVRAILRRLGTLAIAICGLLFAGTLGFVLAENVTVWNGFIWALDTVATVGSVPSPHSTGGQLVKVALIVLGVGTLFYALVTVTDMFVSGHLASLLSERRMPKVIDATHAHFIIYLVGRPGRPVGRHLQARGA